MLAEIWRFVSWVWQRSGLTLNDACTLWLSFFPAQHASDHAPVTWFAAAAAELNGKQWQRNQSAHASSLHQRCLDIWGVAKIKTKPHSAKPSVLSAHTSVKYAMQTHHHPVVVFVSCVLRYQGLPWQTVVNQASGRIVFKGLSHVFVQGHKAVAKVFIRFRI